MEKRQVGDIILLEATGDFAPGIKCVVLDVDDNGEILKAMSLVKDERLLKLGFLMEGDNYIVLQWRWSDN